MAMPPHNFSRKSAKAKPAGKVSAALPEVANLETDGQRLKVYELTKLLKHKAPRIPHGGRPATSLGDVLVPWFEKNVQRPGEKLAGVSEAWVAHVPAKLARHTRLVSLTRGTLTVAVDNSIAKAELDAALRGGLNKVLKTALGATLYRVKLTLDSLNIPEIS